MDPLSFVTGVRQGQAGLDDEQGVDWAATASCYFQRRNDQHPCANALAHSFAEIESLDERDAVLDQEFPM